MKILSLQKKFTTYTFCSTNVGVWVCGRGGIRALGQWLNSHWNPHELWKYFRTRSTGVYFGMSSGTATPTIVGSFCRVVIFTWGGKVLSEQRAIDTWTPYAAPKKANFGGLINTRAPMKPHIENALRPLQSYRLYEFKC